MIKTDTVQIRKFFIEETIDLNNETFMNRHDIIFSLNLIFKEDISKDIRKNNFHDVEIIPDKTGQNLMDAMAFQRQFILATCNALESRFENNHIMTTFKVMGPTNMASREVGLANWMWLF